MTALTPASTRATHTWKLPELASADSTRHDEDVPRSRNQPPVARPSSDTSAPLPTFAELVDEHARKFLINGLRQEDLAAAACVSSFLPGVFAAAYDHEGRYLWVCDAFESILGISRSSVLGRRLDALFPRDWCDERTAVIRRSIDTQSAIPTVEIFRGRRVEGMILPAQSSTGSIALLMGRFGLALPAAPVRPGAQPPPTWTAQAQLLEHADWGPLSVLTRRELEVLRFIAMGMDNAQIAKAIYRTKRAVESHIKNLYEYLRCEQRTDLFRFGLHAGLADIDEEHWQRIIARVRSHPNSHAADADHA